MHCKDSKKTTVNVVKLHLVTVGIFAGAQDLNADVKRKNKMTLHHLLTSTLYYNSSERGKGKKTLGFRP